jgi:hypothetical protein
VDGKEEGERTQLSVSCIPHVFYEDDLQASDLEREALTFRIKLSHFKPLFLLNEDPA